MPMWLRRYCIACYGSVDFGSATANSLQLCAACLDELSELQLEGWSPANFSPKSEITDVASLLRYRGVVRDLVLRAKVRGDHKALALLVALVAHRNEAMSLISWCDAVVANPSSLWGRIRGRLDIAGKIASHLASIAGKPLLNAPLDLHWRWQKHALTDRNKRKEIDPIEAIAIKWAKYVSSCTFHQPIKKHHGLTRILLVDDVLTTGSTLQRTAIALSRDQPVIVRGLTVARA